MYNKKIYVTPNSRRLVSYGEKKPINKLFSIYLNEKGESQYQKAFDDKKPIVCTHGNMAVCGTSPSIKIEWKNVDGKLGHKPSKYTSKCVSNQDWII